ncbi:MAG: DUF4293 domain-containing protein [Bacteroidales bacterium]|nr:DUF4293 domain-containing protein [Bacteroidales bacterium]
MIQRIQSLLLLIAAGISVAITFLTIGNFNFANTDFVYTAFHIQNMATGATHSTFYVAGLWYISAILSLVTIFMYKNRPSQVKLNGINMLVMLGALVTMLYLYPNFIFEKMIAGFKEDMMIFNHWVFLALIPAVCLFFANRAIKSDEKKVRAADRLR